jgi:hypothetical protein
MASENKAAVSTEAQEQPGTAEPEAQPAPGAVYTAPAILWEQRFVALASVSPPNCEGNPDPSCQD